MGVLMIALVISIALGINDSITLGIALINVSISFKYRMGLMIALV